MQPQNNELQLFELLTRTIKELERIEDDSKTLNFVSRRLGNIVQAHEGFAGRFAATRGCQWRRPSQGDPTTGQYRTGTAG